MVRYSPEIAAEICERLAAGESLRAICRDLHMPTENAVREWATKDVDGFAARYAHARELGYEAMAADIIDISDEQVGSTDSGGTDSGAVARNRLRVDSRKWLLSKMLPKIYGDKLAIGGADDLPPIKTMDDGALAARIAELQAKVDGDKG